jgi:two-component sensor histidine kinase
MHPRAGWVVRIWALAVGPWALVGLLSSAVLYLSPFFRGQPASVNEALARQLPLTVFWTAITPLLVVLARRYRVRRPHAVRHLLVLGAGAVVVHLAVGMLQFAIERLWFPPHERSPFGALLVECSILDFATFGAVVAGVQAFDWYRGYRATRRRALRLRTELAETQLELLRMQLQPHFVFNALQAISELVHADPARAEQAIVGMGDLLRRSLSSSQRAVLPLSEELASLGTYVDLEKIRLRERLEVEVDVDDDALALDVPNTILQPIVENSIRHGLRGRERGRITITGRRENGTLQLVVDDDGRGPASPAPPLGTGLGNVRARMARLYGDAAGVALEARPGGGARVRVWLPAYGVR